MRNKIRHLCILIGGYFIKIYAAGQTRFEDAKVHFDINGLLSELNEKQMLLVEKTLTLLKSLCYPEQNKR